MKNFEEALSQFGFKCEKSTDGFITNFSFIRKKEKSDERIFISQKRYKKTIDTYDNKILIPKVRISFYEVERILGEILSKDFKKLYTIHQNSFVDVERNGIDGLHREEGLFVVNTELEMEKYTNFLKDFYHKHAQPFFERFKELKDADGHISTLENNQLQSFVSDAGANTALHRAVIIKYLSKNPDAENYHKHVKKELHDNLDEGVITDMFNLLLKIESKLQVSVKV